MSKQKTTKGAASPSTRWRYVGPFYTKHITLADGFQAKPFHYTTADGEVEAFLQKYPDRAAWFEQITDEQPSTEI